MKKSVSIIFTAFLVSSMLCACSNQNDESNADSSDIEIAQEESEASSLSADEIYSEITASDYILIDDAYSQLSACDALSGDAQTLYDRITTLRNCAGRFVQTSEESTNRYTADVTFYYSYGDLYCNIKYTGYMGEIADGSVQECTEPGYYFESFPKGEFYGREQDFIIYFGKEKLYVSWADTCEYTLTRGDGSAESVSEHRSTLEESELWDTLNETIDKYYSSYEHCVDYQEDEKLLNIYIQAPDITRIALQTENENLLESWQSVAEATCTLNETIYTSLQIGDYVYNVCTYWVDELNDENDYPQSVILLLVDNETIVYNYADYAGTSSVGSYTSGQHGYGSTASATSGERNALNTAMSYLSVMAFSYDSLIDQLEYEGYSASEAEYAADHCGADWNQQAAKKAKEYLDVMSFSESGLIEQLEYEGFTHEQAVYGVSQAY